jgi:hypothetical protein
MTVFTKPDRTGRSSDKIAGKRMREALGMPKGVGWSVAVPYELLTSPALIAVSGAARSVLDGIMAEQAAHGGKENGNLIVTYDNLVAREIRRGSIRRALIELRAVGLIAITQGYRSYGSRMTPSRYRLTWLGTPDGLTATNEWRAIKTIEDARVRIANAIAEFERRQRRAQKQDEGADIMSAKPHASAA